MPPSPFSVAERAALLIHNKSPAPGLAFVVARHTIAAVALWRLVARRLVLLAAAAEKPPLHNAPLLVDLFNCVNRQAHKAWRRMFAAMVGRVYLFQYRNRLAAIPVEALNTKHPAHAAAYYFANFETAASVVS
jgi:hypothetical protein